MFIFEKPMNHKEINSYLDALARVKKEDNSGLARKAREIAEQNRKKRQ